MLSPNMHSRLKPEKKIFAIQGSLKGKYQYFLKKIWTELEKKIYCTVYTHYSLHYFSIYCSLCIYVGILPIVVVVGVLMISLVATDPKKSHCAAPNILHFLYILKDIFNFFAIKKYSNRLCLPDDKMIFFRIRSDSMDWWWRDSLQKGHITMSFSHHHHQILVVRFLDLRNEYK